MDDYADVYDDLAELEDEVRYGSIEAYQDMTEFVVRDARNVEAWARSDTTMEVRR